MLLDFDDTRWKETCMKRIALSLFAVAVVAGVVVGRRPNIFTH